MAHLINSRNGHVFLTELREAQGPWQRCIGLMFRSSLAETHGVLFRPARGVHTHFMRFPIDLVYLDAKWRVTAIRPAMRPWRLDLRAGDAVIETNAGAARAADLRIGDHLDFKHQ